MSNHFGCCAYLCIDCFDGSWTSCHWRVCVEGRAIGNGNGNGNENENEIVNCAHSYFGACPFHRESVDVCLNEPTTDKFTNLFSSHSIDKSQLYFFHRFNNSELEQTIRKILTLVSGIGVATTHFDVCFLFASKPSVYLNIIEIGLLSTQLHRIFVDFPLRLIYDFQLRLIIFFHVCFNVYNCQTSCSRPKKNILWQKPLSAASPYSVTYTGLSVWTQLCLMTDATWCHHWYPIRRRRSANTIELHLAKMSEIYCSRWNLHHHVTNYA